MANKSGTDLADVLKGTPQADILNGFGGDDTLSGLGGNDTLIGGSGDDKLYGGLGDDLLFGSSGADRLDGGDGTDWALYLTTNGTTGVTVSLLKHKGFGGDAAGDRLFNIENVQGTNFADTLIGDAGNNFLDAGNGKDRLFGGLGDDVLAGGAGADRLNGGDGSDYASYNDRNAKKAVHVDLLNHVFKGGDAAGDKLISIENVVGTKFGDFLQGDAASNVLDGGAGNDTINSGGGNDQLRGGNGNDHLADTSVGVGSVVIFDPGAGLDTIVGNGDDVLFYAGAAAGVSIDLLAGTAGGAAAGDVYQGILSVTGSAFDDVLVSGNGGNAQIRGLAGGDNITLHGTLDVALGGDGNDRITLLGRNENGQGGAGDDILDASNASGPVVVARAFLIGGEGNDTLIGGALRTVFFGLQFDQGADTIAGFTRSAGDKLAVNGAEFGIGATLDPAELTNAPSVTATTAGPQFIFNTLTQELWFDRDGTGAAFAAVDIAHIPLPSGQLTLSNPDFLVY